MKKGRIRLGSMKADLPVEAFMHILDSFEERTGAAETCLKAMKAAFKWGRSRSGFPTSPHVLLISTPHKGKGGATAWTEEDEAQFLNRHGPGTMARRWFYLARTMAGRIGDTNDIGPKNIKFKNGRAYLGWQPKKKGSKYVEVPLMLELVEELEAGPYHAEAFLVTDHGNPFKSPKSLSNRIAKWVVQAGLCKEVEVEDPKTKMKETVRKPTRSQHGVRKYTAHELAHAGASIFEVAARLSHGDVNSSAPYVEDVDRARLAESGFARVEQARNSRGVPRPENRGTPQRSGANVVRLRGEKWQPVGESNPSFQVENLAS